MELTLRRYQPEADYWRVRQFLREVYLCNNRRELSWSLDRWDYWRWHVNENIYRLPLESAVSLWETRGGRLAAVLNPDHPGEAFFQVHPDFRSPNLEVEMISTAEMQLATRLPGGGQSLVLWSPGQDSLRQEILKRRGYSPQDGVEYQRRCSLPQPVQDIQTPQGYTIRALGDVGEHPARSWLSWKAFHPDEPDERYEGWGWYRNVQRAPLYRRDLDLVAVSAGGEMAAFCTLWFDDVTRMAAFEPVGAHPAHQRRGLGRAIMTEGLRRAQALGATLATVSSYSEAAGGLYASVGFTEFDLSVPWVKSW
jgi:GNAT superfamily N-acetyltransferase